MPPTTTISTHPYQTDCFGCGRMVEWTPLRMVWLISAIAVSNIAKSFCKDWQGLFTCCRYAFDAKYPAHGLNVSNRHQAAVSRSHPNLYDALRNGLESRVDRMKNGEYWRKTAWGSRWIGRQTKRTTRENRMGCCHIEMLNLAKDNMGFV